MSPSRFLLVVAGSVALAVLSAGQAAGASITVRVSVDSDEVQFDTYVLANAAGQPEGVGH